VVELLDTYFQSISHAQVKRGGVGEGWEKRWGAFKDPHFQSISHAQVKKGSMEVKRRIDWDDRVVRGGLAVVNLFPSPALRAARTRGYGEKEAYNVMRVCTRLGGGKTRKQARLPCWCGSPHFTQRSISHEQAQGTAWGAR
jgi:hypothetical protein